jgi:hypothetical protein
MITNPRSFFDFPSCSNSNDINIEIDNKKYQKQNKNSEAEFNKISLKSELENKQINLNLTGRFRSNIDAIYYDHSTLNKTNILKYVLVSDSIQVLVIDYFKGTYTKMMEVMMYK